MLASELSSVWHSKKTLLSWKETVPSQAMEKGEEPVAPVSHWITLVGAWDLLAGKKVMVERGTYG